MKLNLLILILQESVQNIYKTTQIGQIPNRDFFFYKPIYILNTLTEFLLILTGHQFTPFPQNISATILRPH